MPSKPLTPDSGTLFVVATPIGNLSDFSRRAEGVLTSVDIILCEDTRHTQKLLVHFGIERQLESYHDFSESEKAPRLVDRLLGGTSMALVSDAGTPTLSDPGYRLVRECRQRGVPVVPVPGPSAAIAALSVSGLPTDEFLFVGFLPSRKEARRRKLATLAACRCTLIIYEAPHRLHATLEDLGEVLGDREVFVGREMTKFHEEYTVGRVSELIERVNQRGEAVVVVGGATEGAPGEAPPVDLDGLSRQDVVKLAARRLGVGRKQLYEVLFRKHDGPTAS